MILVARIKRLVLGLIDYIQRDYNSGIPETQTFLYQMFWGARDGSFDFYEQARKMFLRTNESSRKVAVTLEYPKDKVALPCIVVREPSRQQTQPNPFGGIGDPESSFGALGYQREAFSVTSNSKVNLMCFSDNPMESLLMGEVLYALLQGARNTFEEEFLNFSFSTSELVAENSLFPLPVIIKTVSIDVTESEDCASLIRQDLMSCVKFESPIPVSDFERPEPEPIGKYFFFTNPYLWLDALVAEGDMGILSNTDWVLEYGGELFNFGVDILYLNNENYGEQTVMAQTTWTLE